MAKRENGPGTFNLRDRSIKTDLLPRQFFLGVKDSVLIGNIEDKNFLRMRLLSHDFKSASFQVNERFGEREQKISNQTLVVDHRYSLRGTSLSFEFRVIGDVNSKKMMLNFSQNPPNVDVVQMEAQKR